MKMPSWEICEDRATEREILSHLEHCDARFVPPLSDRVDVSVYAARLHTNASRIEAWSDGCLIGLIAVYFGGDGSAESTAFVSNVSIEQNFLGHGLASALLENCIKRARAIGFRRLRLEVGANNMAARRLYEKHGFQDCAKRGDQILMQLNLLEAIQ